MTITTFFKTPANRFIAEGDYNVKIGVCGYGLTTTKGRELHKVMTNNNLKHLSTRQHTYWPSDSNKIPDLVDFCVTKGTDIKKIHRRVVPRTHARSYANIDNYVHSHTRKTKETVLIQQTHRLGLFSGNSR
jgi:hypothetical protein